MERAVNSIPSSDDRDPGQAVRVFRAILTANFEFVLRRFEADPAYPYVNTKYDVLSGQDFRADDPVRGPGVVYGWIQGRGLEALAEWARWLERDSALPPAERRNQARRVRAMLRAVCDRMETVVGSLGGRLWFMFTPDGRLLRTDAGRVVPMDLPLPDAFNLSDVFYAKGLADAADALQDAALAALARDRMERIWRDQAEGRFVSDQQPFDPKNPVLQVPGRHTLAGWMIGLGAMELFLRLTGDGRYLERGAVCLEQLLSRHTNLAATPAIGLPHDVWEYVDDRGQPYREGALLRSDPGHACEIVGLASKLCAAAGPAGAALRGRLPVLGRMLRRNFANGFAPSKLGMVKTFDLVARRPINTDMPWWSMPETMRAALYCGEEAAPEERPEFTRIFADCYGAFLQHYVRPERHSLAVQTLGADGQPAAVIPATPDADPGYHTGLSLLDCLRLLQQGG